MNEFAAKFPLVMVALFGASISVLLWLVRREIRGMDKKLETVLITIFGDGKDTDGVLARLKLLEHDYSKCCGGSHQRAGDSDPTPHCRIPPNGSGGNP